VVRGGMDDAFVGDDVCGQWLLCGRSWVVEWTFRMSGWIVSDSSVSGVMLVSHAWNCCRGVGHIHGEVEFVR
jgi:hypothetical protein